MASVTYSAGIDHVSGALAKPGKSGQHSCEKMLLATHRTAATTSNKCNRIYLRTPVKRTSPLTQREHQIRNRFIGVAAMIQERSHDLSKITTDQQTFIAQKNEPNGAKTMNSKVLNMHHGMEERLVVEVGAVADAGLVGIDGVDGVVEHFADLLVVRDTQPDERKDTKFGREELVTLDRQLFSLTQERVEVPDEVREDMQE